MQWSQPEKILLQAKQLRIKCDFVVLAYTLIAGSLVETLKGTCGAGEGENRSIW